MFTSLPGIITPLPPPRGAVRDMPGQNAQSVAWRCQSLPVKLFGLNSPESPGSNRDTCHIVRFLALP